VEDRLGRFSRMSGGSERYFRYVFKVIVNNLKYHADIYAAGISEDICVLTNRSLHCIRVLRMKKPYKPRDGKGSLYEGFIANPIHVV
jgi:hypothetical protein